MGLPQAPGAVVMRFTEPLVRGASSIEVRDAVGADATDGPTAPVQGDANAMRRPLGLLPPGVYTVSWTTTSPLDGHTLKGTYKFAIGGSTLGEETLADGPLSSEGWLGLVGRAAALTGLVLWVGAAVADRVAAGAGVAASRRRLLARLGPPLVAVGVAASLVSSALVAGGSLAVLDELTLASQSGRLRVGLIVVAATAVALQSRPRARFEDPLTLTTRALVIVAVSLEAAAGHAASSAMPAVATLTFAAHLTAVGVWVYAVAAAVSSGGRTREVLARFTPVAVTAGALVAVTGLAAAALVLHGPGDLLHTAYGRVLAAKTVAVAVVAWLGLRHRQRRHVNTDGVRGASELRRLVRGEAAVMALVVVLATALVAFPNPPAEAEAAEGALDVELPLADLAERPAVTLADTDGPYTVGLAVLPPQPGDVDLRVQLLAAEPGDGVRDVTVTAHPPSGGDPVETTLTGDCGAGCFAGQARLEERGAWRVRVHATTNRQPITARMQLQLPAADGTAVMDRMFPAMEALDSAEVVEELRAEEGGLLVTSEYEFESGTVDAIRWRVNGGASIRIGIGTRGFIKSGAEPWEAYEWTGDGFHWPERFYRSFFADADAVRVLGTEQIGGVQTTAVGFVVLDYPAWFRLWVDDNGLIRRLEMLAERHFMDQTYGPFNEPVSITPPPAELVAPEDGR